MYGFRVITHFYNHACKWEVTGEMEVNGAVIQTPR